MERTGTIYHIFNTKNGKCYIGQTWRSIKERWGEHKTTFRCAKLSRAIKKYGVSSFIVSTLTPSLKTQENMDRAEIYWIEYFNSIEDGYNLRTGGSHGSFSEETRKKLSVANSGENSYWFGRTGDNNPNFGKPRSEDTKKKISEANSGKKNGMFGKRLSEEHREKIRKANSGEKNYLFGKHLPEETRKKMSEALSGEKHPMFRKHPSQETLKKRNQAIKTARAKPFQCLKESSSHNGRIYNNIIDAARELGLNKCCINDILHDRQKTTKGYIFKYIGTSKDDK